MKRKGYGGRLTELPAFLGGRGHFGRDGVAFLLEHDVVVLPYGSLALARPERGRSSQRVRERIPPRWEWLRHFASGLNGDVENPHRRVRQLLHAVRAMRLAGDDLDAHLLVVDLDGWDLRCAQITVSRLTFL